MFCFPSFGIETSMKFLYKNVTPSGICTESFQTFTTIVVDEAKTFFNTTPSVDKAYAVLLQMLSVFKTLEVFCFPSFGTETSKKFLCKNITANGLSIESFQTFTTLVVDEVKTFFHAIPFVDESYAFF